MFRPRSDIDTLQRRDIEFTFENNSSSRNQIVLGMTLYIRQPKEAQSKTAGLGRLDLESMCPRAPENHSLFLIYLMEPSKIRPFNLISVANIVKKYIQAAGIDTKIYSLHAIRSTSNTKAAELSNEIDKIKKHANWSLSANTFERFYYKPPHQHAGILKAVRFD
ncbi:hypothetical protein G6F70_007916 [Rhizopus microsporus]|nr:hypothetical protein G6F71_007900 [Rhizopus microsporus]KAG1195848.1 hypothetical protein G6F70_007916 [Rhizopus microsporus]KAG1211345.1 hypothetical protein G6F69_004668 [Rhizopus microsporus]KAG1233147.1 hypothetical protein G6F67_004488 [Rhizopus microsporus]KAG1260627.1 hypothetical protein G6F68_007300 [Rhizopus microsporus]